MLTYDNVQGLRKKITGAEGKLILMEQSPSNYSANEQTNTSEPK
jgi:hypothetical protein